MADAASRAETDAVPIRLTWSRTWVDDRPALYGVVGEGLPVLFLHGWALGHRSYRDVVARLVEQGCRVYLPALPGFGGTPDLPDRDFTLAGYARWVDGFLDAVKLTEPAVLIGHSFGGGVAIKVASLFAPRVHSLVLVNSIGGSAWKESPGGAARSMADRPLWDWGLHFPSDVLPLAQATRVLPVVLQDLVPNLVRNPRALWRVGQIVRRADLTRDLEALKDQKLPVVVLWGARDGVIPKASFDALCRALGSDGEVVDGSHSWLLADPDAFGEVITNHVEVAKLARSLEATEAEAAADDEGRRGFLGLGRFHPRNLRSLAGTREP